MRAEGSVLLREVTVRYGRRVALEAVSGEFASGSLTAVIGANGAGKSTLLAAIAGVVRLAGGAVECAARRRLAYLLSAIDRDYPLRLAELIALGGWREIGAFRAPRFALRQRIAAAALVTAGVTRLVAPVWSSGPNGDGLTRALQSAAEAGADGASSDRADIPTNAASPAILMVVPPLSRSALQSRW